MTLRSEILTEYGRRPPIRSRILLSWETKRSPKSEICGSARSEGTNNERLKRSWIHNANDETVPESIRLATPSTPLSIITPSTTTMSSVHEHEHDATPFDRRTSLPEGERVNRLPDPRQASEIPRRAYHRTDSISLNSSEYARYINSNNLAAAASIRA